MTDYDRVPAPGDYPEAVADMPWPLIADGFTITWDPAPGGCVLALERTGPCGEWTGYRASGITMQAAWDKVQAQFAETPEDTPLSSRVPRTAAHAAYGEHVMTPSSRRSAPEGKARPAPGGPVPEAERLGRLHARAAVHWQIGGGSTTPDARAGYRRLLRGLTEADPEITSLFQVPDLTGARDGYGREDLAADLGLAATGDDLDAAEGAYRAAAAEEFLAEAARHCRLHLGEEEGQPS